MRVLVLGGDGYLGWPTAMAFAAKGHEVWTIDNYLRRRLARETDSEPLLAAPDLEQRAKAFEAATGKRIGVAIGDCLDFSFLKDAVRRTQPDAVIHYAEQPSAPYSMRDHPSAALTLQNNLLATLNIAWAIMQEAPDAHLIKLGTMGEYGTPNIDIEEGWIDIGHKGRKDRFLFPRQASSLYHTTKILDTDLLWFYVRVCGMRVTDLMQGPVYGIHTPQCQADERLWPNFHYDDIFGTVVNRFLVQAVAGVPLTVYGKGGQKRGYLNLLDTLQCVELAMLSPAGRGELRILNQFTETFTVLELAERVRRVGDRLGLEIRLQNVPNPRKELEEHYYNPAHSGFAQLGLKPHFLTDDVVASMLEAIMPHRKRIESGKIMPRVRWNG